MSGIDAPDPSGSEAVVNRANRTTRANTDEPATVAVRRLPGAIVVAVTGEIDMITAPALQDAVRESLAAQPDTLVIDLTEAHFFSSAGLAVLVFAHRHSGRSALRVVASAQVVLRPLELTGLADDLAIRPDLQSALAG